MIEYKAAAPGDVHRIREFLEKVWYATYSGMMPEEVIRKAVDKWFDIHFLAQQSSDPEVFFLLAMEAGEIVGLTTARMLDNENTLNLGRLYVHPQYQGKGLGSILLTKALNSFSNYHKIRLGVIQGNHHAISFYQRKGFIQTGRETEDIDGYPIVVLIMEIHS